MNTINIEQEAIMSYTQKTGGTHNDKNIIDRRGRKGAWKD